MSTQPPNILWICTDQQRFDTLGCYGNPHVDTPNLDRLAEDAVLFEHAYVQNPVCTPSRASFLTGRYPRTTRCRQNGQSIPEDETLITKYLHDAGYVCGLSGKLHLSACNPRVCKGTERRIDDGYDQFFWSHDTGTGWLTNEYHQWLWERGVPPQRPSSKHSQYVLCGPPAEHGQTAWCVEKALAFIHAGQRSNQPWLFSLNPFDPHHGFDPPKDALERYAEMIDSVPLPNYTPGELDNKPIWQRTDHEGAYGGKGGYPYDDMAESDHRWVRAAYWAMVDVIDQQVGRLLDALEQTGQRENTIILFHSDHGEMLGDHGIYLKGPYFYEPAVRVPLLVAGPGIQGGRRSDALVELVDLVPTLTDLCGFDALPGVQGRSLAPMLRGNAPLETHREDIYCEFYGSNFSYEPKAHATMIRTQRHKLTVAHGRGAGELYDLESDPSETHNVWDNPHYAPIRHDLVLRLVDRMAWTVDPLPLREAPW